MNKTLSKTVGLAALIMAGAMSAHAAGSEEQWDQALNEAWQLLSPAQRQELKQDEHEWVQWKEKLSDEARYNAIENREMYLRAIIDGKHPDAVQGWNVRLNFDRPTGKISPTEARQVLDREEQQFQQENQEVANMRAQLEASDPHKLIQEDYQMGYRYYQSELDATVGYHAGDPITISEMAIPGSIDEAIVKFKGKITSLSSFERGFRQAIADYAHGGPKQPTQETAPIPTPVPSPTPKAEPNAQQAYKDGYHGGASLGYSDIAFEHRLQRPDFELRDTARTKAHDMGYNDKGSLKDNFVEGWLEGYKGQYSP